MLTDRALAVAAGLIAVLAALTVVLAEPLPIWAASPTPGDPGIGDPRSSGEGPGFMGDPGMAIAVTMAVAVASVVATYLYVRLTGGKRPQ